MSFITRIALFVIIILPLTVSSQDLPTEEVDVIKDFNARLLDTEKVPLSPELPPLDTTTKRQQYDISSRQIDLQYLPPRIRPLSLRRPPATEIYQGYARLGGGFPQALYGELSYDVRTDEPLDFGIDILHHSANNSNDIENQRFSLTKAQAEATYYFDQGFAVDGRLNYASDNVYFYGYNDINESRDSNFISFASDDVKQRFSLFSGAARIFNGERTEADFNYSAGVDFYFLRDDFSVRENGAEIRISGTKWFNDEHPLKVNLITDLTSYEDTASQTLNNFYLQPSYTYHGDFFRVKAGFNLVAQGSDYFVFPDAEISAGILGNLLTAFVGATGTLRKNTFRRLSDYNPFVESRVNIRNTELYHYYGGVRGQIEGIDYRAEISYKNAEDLPLYLTNQDTVPRFMVLYDTVDIFTIHGSVTAPLFEGFKLIGAVSSHVYSLEREEKAWHLPSLSLNVGASYTTPDQLLQVRADLFVEDGVPFRDENGQADELNALFDLSLGAEYFISENFGLFAQINNLADNRRQRWHRYPIFGLNGLVGINARF